MAKRKPIIVGNWKLNKTIDESLQLVTTIKNMLGSVTNIDVGVAPPFTALWAVFKRLEGNRLILAAQDCYFEPHGAYTGEVSAPLLHDVGCTHVIIGHSERRQYFNEGDQLVNRKVKSAFEHELIPIMCIGEQLSEREAGKTFEVVERQLLGGLKDVEDNDAARMVIAYEPVWAIGTGKVATTAQAQEVHEFLRSKLRERFCNETAEEIRIQYGGSVKPDNVAALMAQPDIDGALVGGASLKAEVFTSLLKNCA